MIDIKTIDAKFNYFYVQQITVLMSRSHPEKYRHNNREFSSIDDFEIIDKLGKGGYSVVYLVKHKSTGKKYALKCAMKFKKGKDRSERTRQEIEVLSDLRHRRIIRLKGWFEDDDNIYLVLQYLSGGDLSKYFRQDLPDKETTIKIMTQIINAVKYCHRKGIIHRDIKLDNILINKRMNIKLTDFGLCAIRSNNHEYFYDEVGTARYTAPELLSKEGYDESIDVWGIGVILFLLLTGKYPFDGSKRKSIFRRIRKKRLDYDKYNLEDDEVHLLKRLLCKNPRYRIQLDDITDAPWFNSGSSE